MCTDFPEAIKLIPPNYSHSEFDLSNTDLVKDFEFPEPSELKDESIIFVNNSAAISKVKRLGNISPEKIIHDYNVKSKSLDYL
ncbi:MAG: hypothetical protein R2942_02765 [Ignavibacteria bacterium]